MIMFRNGNLFIAGGKGFHRGAVESHPTANRAVKEPERNIDPFDLFDMIRGGKRFGQEFLSFIIVFQRFHRILFAHPERDHIIGLEGTAELPGDHRGVIAVGTAGGGGGFLADQLRTAGRTGISPHGTGILPPIVADGRKIPAFGGFFFLFLRRFFRGFHRFFFLGGVKSLDLFHFKTASAVFTFQFTGVSGKMQRAGTGRTFMICYLRRHAQTSFTDSA